MDSHRIRRLKIQAVVCVVVFLAQLTVPLLRVVHLETAILWSTVFFFLAGWAAVSGLKAGLRARDLLFEQWLLAAIPLALMTLSSLASGNSGWRQGLAFYGLFPMATIPFSVGLACLLLRSGIRYPRFIHATMGVCIMMTGPVFDLGFHAQFFTYNHVFGGVLGPIYDERLTIRSGLLAFRSLTLVWGLTFWLVSVQLVRPRRRQLQRILLLVCVIAGAYLARSEVGFNRSDRSLQESLGSVVHTKHFDIWYDSLLVDPPEIAWIAEDHEYHFERLKSLTNERPDQRINSYLFRSQERRSHLTGARRTSVTPVWRPKPSMHVLLDNYRTVFPHELAHVFSREFGLPLLKASLLPGLVEGWAVATEPPDGLPSPDELTRALLEKSDSTPQEYATRIATGFDPAGFWSQRGSTSYSEAGAFVSYLERHAGPEKLKAAYPLGRFEKVYGRTAQEMAIAWMDSLGATRPDSAALQLADLYLAEPPLAEKRSPHFMADWELATDKALEALVLRDTTLASTLFEDPPPCERRGRASWATWVNAQKARPELVASWAEECLGDDGRVDARLHLIAARARLLQGRLEQARQLASRGLQLTQWYERSTAATLHLVAGSASGDSSSSSLLGGLELLSGRAYQEAASLLGKTPCPLDEPVVNQRCHVWRAEAFSLAGEPEEAIANFLLAKEASERDGDKHEMERLDERIKRLEWSLRRRG